MNDLTPLRIDPPLSDTRFTPGGFQERRVVNRRRLVMAVLTLSMIASLLYVLGRVLGSDGWTFLDVAIFVSFAISAPWTVMGFWNAVIGFCILHFAKDPTRIVSPFAELPAATGPLALRTAIL